MCVLYVDTKTHRLFKNKKYKPFTLSLIKTLKDNAVILDSNVRYVDN